MKKISMFILCIMYVLLCMACEKKENADEHSKVTETEAGTEEGDVEGENNTEEQIDYWYLSMNERYFLKNHIYYNAGYDYFITPWVDDKGYGYGKVVMYDGLREFLEQQKDSDEIYYAVVLREISGKLTDEFYYDYVKNLGLRTEVDGLSDEELEQAISEMAEIDRQTGMGKKGMGCSFCIYATKAELLSLTECPSDMCVFIDSDNRCNVRVDEETLALYGEEEIPIERTIKVQKQGYHGMVYESYDTVYEFISLEEAKEAAADGKGPLWGWKLMDEKTLEEAE